MAMVHVHAGGHVPSGDQPHERGLVGGALRGAGSQRACRRADAGSGSSWASTPRCARCWGRALDPRYKLAATEWVAADAAISGLDVISDDQAYRAMDPLVEADATAKVQEAMFFSVANLLNLEVDVLLFDTTSTYFETDPDVTANGEPGFLC